MRRPTSKVGLLESNIADHQEPADADTVVRSGSFEQSLQGREAKRLPDELGKGRVGTVGESVNDGDEEEEVGLRV